MEITAIKHQLTMAQVLAYYGLKPDKHNRIHCPFHKDKTPSMQIYPKTQTAYCFSSNCKTSGKSMDVIDFIMHQENSTKAAAIKQAKAMIGYVAPHQPHPMMDAQEKAQTQAHATTGFLEQLHHYFCHAVSKSTPAKTYLAQRSLDYKTLAQQGIPVGYNSGQFHHGTRRDEALIN